MLSEMTNVVGDMFGWMAGRPRWLWPWGEPWASFWGRPRVASRAGLSGCNIAVLPDQPALGV